MCDTLQLQNFLQRQAQEARRRMQHRDKLEEEEEDLVSSCLQVCLKSPVCRSSQMIPCCRRLMEERSPQMQGLPLYISHFCSVMQDGDLCIPWDCKG
ncbi:T-cell activation inhibitor, mitochondrial-like [Carassius carassius]|uniref:T-cell activation inhibitor, mitochondrial-like n=1 Tax=Carassius carassius TaxID=217509 RepID=UPI0028690E1B|nr:T-cell activation inhibitor, mitochondrial-like [Carassius carassius]